MKHPTVLAWTAMGMRSGGIGAYVDLRDWVRDTQELEEKLQVAISALDEIEANKDAKPARNALLKLGFYTDGK